MTREVRLGRILTRRGRTISTVESCTGGGLACRITRVPGASAYYIGSVVAYANRVKSEWVGVPEEIFERHGAVSAEAAGAMSEGGRSRFDTDLCVSITGIAGPAGGTTGKPVGTVFISVASWMGTRTVRIRLDGSREQVRQSAIDAALDMALEVAAAD